MSICRGPVLPLFEGLRLIEEIEDHLLEHGRGFSRNAMADLRKYLMAAAAIFCQLPGIPGGNNWIIRTRNDQYRALN